MERGKEKEKRGKQRNGKNRNKQYVENHKVRGRDVTRRNRGNKTKVKLKDKDR